MRVAVFFSALVIAASFAGEAAAATTTTTTMVYNGKTYNLNSSSTCPDGSSALRYKRKWWCLATTTTTTTPPPTTTTTPTTYNAAVSWTIPTTRADGTPLSVSELQGYEVYYTDSTGTVSQVLPVSGGSTASTTVSSLSSGSYSFSVSAIDTTGMKSALSAVVAISYP